MCTCFKLQQVTVEIVTALDIVNGYHIRSISRVALLPTVTVNFQRRNDNETAGVECCQTPQLCVCQR